MKIQPEKLYEIYDHLIKLEEIKGLRSLHHDKPSISKVRKFEAFIGFKLPKSISQIRRKMGGLNIQFLFRENSSDIGVNSRTLIVYLGIPVNPSESNNKEERLKKYLWEADEDNPLIKTLENNYFILDYISLRGNVYTIFKINKKTNEPQLYLYKYPHYQYPLLLDFAQYFEYTVEFRGIYCWQDYFIDRKNTEKEALDYLDAERPDRFKKDIATIHPEADLSVIPLPLHDHSYSFSDLAAEKKYAERFEKKWTDFAAKLNEKGFDYELTKHDQALNILLIRKIEQVLGRKLPDSILAFYSQLNGFELEWEYPDEKLYGKKPSYYPAADFHLLGLEQVFGGFEPWNNRIWHEQMFEGIVTMENVMSEEQMNFAKQCRPIYISELTTVVMRFVENEDEPRLYVMDEGADFIPLTLSFADFIEKLLDNLGMDDWPWFFTDEKELDTEGLSYFSPIVRFINDVFPEADTSTYRKANSNIKIPKND